MTNPNDTQAKQIIEIVSDCLDDTVSIAYNIYVVLDSHTILIYCQYKL